MLHKCPNKYNFLAGLVCGLVALVAIWFIDHISEVVCSLFQSSQGATCSVFPPLFYVALLFFAAAGPLHSIYRYYCDFHLGEYYQRVADAGWLERAST